VYLIFPKHATCPSHLTFLYLIIATILVMRISHEAPYYTIFSSHLLHHLSCVMDCLYTVCRKTI
jgi:hypothetical protein